jgi:hypothetical protein
MSLFPQSLLPRARSLEADLGVDEVAWRRDDALEVLARLGEGVAVLGGDVYAERGGRLRPGDASWSCERQAGEDLPAYAARSRGVAAAYLRAFREAAGGATYYALVVSADETADL